jgi:hypothetical protein
MTWKRFPTLIPFAATLAFIAAACGTTTPPSHVPATPAASPSAGTSSPAPSAAAARLVLRVTTEGGFIGPAANLNAIPQVSVYADGRIMTPGPIDAIYPGPLLPPVAIKNVGAAGAEAIVAAIRAAGLDKQVDGGGVAADTGTTVFAVNVDGSVVTSRLFLGGGLPGRPGIGSPDPAVVAASELLNRLTDPAETWGSANPTTSVLVPTAYRIFVAPGAPASDGVTTNQRSVTWPLSTPLAQFGAPANPDRGIAGLRQGAVFGADAATLAPLLAAANSQTAFISDGMLYTLYVRPLLPDEVPIPD